MKGFVAIALVLCSGLLGCGGGDPEEGGRPETPREPIAHLHRAPHGGTLVELGEEFAHIEFVLDPAAGRLTAYLLDGEAENAVRIAQPSMELSMRLEGAAEDLVLSLAAVASPLTGESAGDTSQFEIQNDRLKGISRFSGWVKLITLKGKSFDDVGFNFPQGNE